MFGDSIQRRSPGVLRPVFLRSLDLLPIRPHLIHIFDFQLPKNMRMPSNELVHDVPRDFVEVKRSALFPKLAVENHLQQQIAQLLNQLMIVISLDRIHQFVNFLNRMPPQRPVVLFPVPRTSLWRTQTLHDTQQILNRNLVFHLDALKDYEIVAVDDLYTF